MNVFKNVNFEKRLLKNKNFFKKAGKPFFSSKYYESKKNIKTKDNVKTN